MTGNKRWLLALLGVLIVLMFAFAVDVAAQGTTITFGQPLAAQITAGQTLSYDYALTEPRQITLQALGDTVQPTITILNGSDVVAQQTNAEGTLTTSLNALLNAGNYVVQVGGANNTTGLVVLVLQSETAITSEALSLASPLTASVDPSAPLALYSFTALTEPVFLYVDSSAPAGGAPTSGVGVSLTNTTTGEVSGQFESDLLGARFRVPAGTDAYQVEVHHSGTGAPVSFTVCLASVSAGGCEAGAPLQTPEVPSDVYVPCTVAPAAPGGVNIYQSASTSAIIRDSLPDGAIADVIGISPDQQFYNALYRGTNGWMAVSAVASSGECGIDTILIINPPAVIPATNLQAPTVPPQPTLPPVQPTIVVPPQPVGPCLITMIADQLIYTTPNAIPDYIYDQVHAGYQLIPTGRLADNSWWKTNYADSWIQTAVFGTTAQVSGNCVGLPIVSP